MAAGHYRELDVDLLLTGAILHDIGKLDELCYERAIHYTDEGQLLGHIILGLEQVTKKMDAIEGFPPDLKTLVKHLLISHHGQYEFGSPKLPMFREALVLALSRRPGFQDGRRARRSARRMAARAAGRRSAPRWIAGCCASICSARGEPAAAMRLPRRAELDAGQAADLTKRRSADRWRCALRSGGAACGTRFWIWLRWNWIA